MFFENNTNKNELEGYLRKVDFVTIENADVRSRVSRTYAIVSGIVQAPTEWDKLCHFNIEHIGEKFVRTVSNFDISNQKSINDAYVMAFRFLCEFDFNIEKGRTLSVELSRVRNEIIDHDVKREDEIGLSIRYAAYIMPVSIVKDIVNNPQLAMLRDAAANFQSYQEKFDIWDEDLEEKKSEVEALRTSLDSYKHGFNFVGLYRGFESLHSTKGREKTRLLIALIVMAILILTPLVTEFWFTLNNNYERNTVSAASFLVWLPLASIEVIMIYFFRIILQNFRSVGAQVLQLDLRMTLCQFVQSYIDYAKGVGVEGSDALAKFEGLIFSNIQADPEKLPNTFDGVEQLASIIKGFRE